MQIYARLALMTLQVTQAPSLPKITAALRDHQLEDVWPPPKPKEHGQQDQADAEHDHAEHDQAHQLGNGASAVDATSATTMGVQA